MSLKVHHKMLILGTLYVLLISGVLPETSDDNIDYMNSNSDINKRQGGYGENNHYSNQYRQTYHNQLNPRPNDGSANSPYLYASTNNYNTLSDEVDSSDLYSSTGLERQDSFADDGLSLFAAGLAAGAAIAATIALIQNSNQPSTDDFNSLKDRVSSLESDQTSICTSVKAFAAADDGKTISAGYDAVDAGELGYLTALAAAASPTCSWLKYFERPTYRVLIPGWIMRLYCVK